DHIEHRRLAGAVGADDGADLALADVERDAGQGAHAAERQRNVLDREQHLADPRIARGRRSHAARSILAVATGKVRMSRIATRAAMTPLWPSSNVTSVEMSAAADPL